MTEPVSREQGWLLRSEEYETGGQVPIDAVAGDGYIVVIPQSVYTAAREQDRQRIEALENVLNEGEDGRAYMDMHADLMGHYIHVDDLQQQLATAQARIEELEEWKRIVIGTGTDQEAVIRMAAQEYTKTAVECWKQRLAAVEQERDAYKRKCEQLCCEHGNLLMQHHTLTTALANVEHERDQAKAHVDLLCGPSLPVQLENVRLTTALQQAKGALDKISGYGADGICPFGCDMPHIAQQALAALPAGPDHLGDANTMVWTDAKPTVPGFYWHRHNELCKPTIYELGDGTGKLRIVHGCAPAYELPDCGQWSSQPIPLPPDGGE